MLTQLHTANADRVDSVVNKFAATTGDVSGMIYKSTEQQQRAIPTVMAALSQGFQMQAALLHGGDGSNNVRIEPIPSNAAAARPGQLQLGGEVPGSPGIN